ncbi:MAG: hypothetical protein PF549_00040, partial [Patescibacteria group bacterium]|nr:hypothetical protein [Patescibacteria group bacterium]
EFKKYEIDISGEREARKNEGSYQESADTEYEKIMKKMEAIDDYDKKFSVILEILESNEISRAVKDKTEEYLTKVVDEYANKALNIMNDQNIDMISDFFKNALLEISVSDSVSEKVNDFIIKKEMFVERGVYQKEIEGLVGEAKFKKVSKFPLKYKNILHEDSELVGTVRGKVENLRKLDGDELSDEMDELFGFFGACTFLKGSELDYLKDDYEEFQNDFSEKEKKKRSEKYIDKVLSVDE